MIRSATRRGWLWGWLPLLLAWPACSAPLSPGTGDVSVTFITSWTTAINLDLDVVYVVDHSAATSDWQDKVSAQLPVLMSTAAQCGAGGTPPNIHTMTVSSPDGQLLGGLQAAVSGALRPDAYLIVVLITGGDDSSPLDVATYVAALKSLKSDPDNQILVGAILGPAAPRLTTFAESFRNNTLASIADDAYAPVLTGFCTRGEPAARKPCLPSNAASCVLTEALTTVDGREDLLIPVCETPAQQTPCWSSAPDPLNCPGGGSAITIVNQPTGTDSGHYTAAATMSCQLVAGG